MTEVFTREGWTNRSESLSTLRSGAANILRGEHGSGVIRFPYLNGDLKTARGPLKT